MSESFIDPENSIWPNGLKLDDEGYVMFYPLGTNKIDISTVKWPEGYKLVAPFVYDENDKLVGFCDTKSMTTDTNNASIDINYNHFDADFDSIMENTLSINAPENAAINVKWGNIEKVLTEKLERLIGSEKIKVAFDKSSYKATIIVSLDVTESQIADIKNLLSSALPNNLVTEMEWANELPIDYTPVEYLESGGSQWIDTGIILNESSTVKTKFRLLALGSWGFIFGARLDVLKNAFCFFYDYDKTWLMYGTSSYTNKAPVLELKEYELSAKMNIWTLDEIGYELNKEAAFNTNCTCRVFASANNGVIDSRLGSVRIYYFEANNGAIKCRLLPALDPTGTPCMYDIISKQPFYNLGTGDFIYPTDAAPAMALDMNEKFYAKLTEHGIRRLYRMPNGYSGTKDEYAAMHDFKELIEPSMPLEGYWIPQWRETETQLICDWVETEPPAEEIIFE